MQTKRELLKIRENQKFKIKFQKYREYFFLNFKGIFRNLERNEI